MQPDEIELLQRAARRDRTAWSRLYEAHFDDIYTYAYSRLGVREEAEDVAAQVFLDALAGASRLARYISDPRKAGRARPLLAWLLDHARKQITTRHRRALRARAALLAPVAEPGDAAGVIERLDLLDALKHLTPQQQDVIILRYFMAKTTPEIAAIMGRNQNAVFALQFRAVRSLRRYLAEDATSQVWRTEAGGS